MQITDLGKKSINQNLLLVLLTALFTILTMLTSYNPIWANIPINVVIPIIVLLKLKTVFFEKLKLSTLVLMRALIVFAALGFLNGQLYVKIVLIFLAINIMEATLTDLKRKKYFNVVTGLLLTVSILAMNGTWFGKYYDANLPTSLGTVLWWIAYTIWNWFFVTNEFSPSIAKYHIGVLASPIIGVLITMNPGLWLIFRANSLTIAGFIQIAKKQIWEKSLKNQKFTVFVETTQKNNVQLLFMIINITLIVASVLL
ncbi:MAG: hypothetical protein MR639_01075 [Clostridium sp.]|uniref:hypothetical protein n=1 Tax=Clostridium sp. TaxID=1506 RepID=UPI002A8C9F50|nr:hypothetical protein [Clostridium sp.]MDY5099285.1 hypothetical protein [Clostridium sp.]